MEDEQPMLQSKAEWGIAYSGAPSQSHLQGDQVELASSENTSSSGTHSDSLPLLLASPRTAAAAP